MQIRTLHRKQWIARPLTEVFSFFCEARNLDLITPSWLHFKVLRQTENELRAGTMIDYELNWHGMPLEWTSRIEEWRPPGQFADLQVKGPYRYWHHTHSFEAVDGGTLIRDTIRFAVPFGALGDLVAGWVVRRDVERIFDYRARKITAIFDAHPTCVDLGRHSYG